MEVTRRIKFNKRAVAKASLTRMQTLIETGDRKLHEIQVRLLSDKEKYCIKDTLLLMQEFNVRNLA